MQIKTRDMDATGRVLQARQAFLHHGLVPADSLRHTIRASWQRSVEYGLTMDAPCEPDSEIRIGSDELYETNRALIDAAVPVMEQLAQHLRQRQERSLLILANTQARVLALEGPRDRSHRALRDLAPGVCWSENVRGTNALGTALVEQQPILIGYGEHFLDRLSPYSCTAVPIRTPDGQVHGVIDLTQQGPLPQPEDWFSVLNLSASQIERRLFCDSFRDHLVLAFHPRLPYLDSSWQGLMAVDDDARVLAMNDTGCQLFGLPRERIVGQRADLLVANYREQLDAWRQGHSGTVQTPRGPFFYKVVHARAPARPVSVPSQRPTAAQAPAGLLELAGSNSAYRQQLQMASRAFNNGLPVVLLGETGSGKEWVAQNLHRASPRADKPFVAVNCAAIPEGLIESELFGYREGAFTGARRGGMVGRLQQAHGGTLFLDEIGDMPLALQARLLRVLQEWRVAPLGGGEEQDLDVALVCATHRDLKQQVSAGRFREDLYYRLCGLSVMLPPLRERHDFEALCLAIVARHAQEPLVLDPQLLTLLRQYDWPGNLRQLDMVLRTAVALWAPEDGPLSVHHLPAATQAELQSREDAPQAGSIRDQELAMIRQAMARHQGNVTQAARSLSISRATLYRKLKQLQP